MKQLITTIFILFILTNTAKSQEGFEMWYKLSPEIRLNKKGTPWELRWRPVDHIILPKYYNQYLGNGRNDFGRTDIMLGVNIERFKLFSYSKFDELGRSWTGIRFDYNTSFFNRKLLLNIQERLFFGLNESSENHYYLVQYIRYRIGKKVQAGILSYGKWPFSKPFNEGNWFVGPSFYMGLPYNFSLHLALSKDILNDNIYMSFFRIGYRIKLKKKQTKEE